MKKRNIICFLVVTSLFFPAVNVYAGDLNGAEAGIISYVSGAVFEYEGVSYVAKPEYITQLRTKLMEDGVDLTEKEANNAILQINANVKAGVTDGYLTPAGGTTEVTTAPTTAPAEPTTGETEADSGDSEKNSQEQNTGSGEGENDSKEQGTGSGENKNNSKEQNTDSETGEKDSKEQNTGSGDGDNDSKVQKTDSEEQKENHQSAGTMPQEEPRETVEIGTFLKDVLNQNTETVNVTTNQGNETTETSNFCVEEYVPAKLTIVSKNGEVLLKGKLPVKNTGYQNKTGYFVIVGIGYCLVLLGIAIKKRLSGREG